MVEDRTRASQFFQYYKPVIEQEITLISEIEKLQSIVEETTKQCTNPKELPQLAEDVINGYKVPEYMTVAGTREQQSGAVSILSKGIDTLLI